MNDHHWTPVILALALLTVPAGLAAADDDPDDHSDWGRCQAYEANEEGRENGNVTNATAFVALEDDAEENNESTSEYCEDQNRTSGNQSASHDGNRSDADEDRRDGDHSDDKRRDANRSDDNRRDGR